MNSWLSDEDKDPFEDKYDELENHFILRLPIECATSLRQALRSGDEDLNKRLTIQFDDMRNGCVRFDSSVMSCELLDLPCIIESQKTIDKHRFYKTADISQILVCQEMQVHPSPFKDYLYADGITPPMKNARKRRFRNNLKWSFFNDPKLDAELESLLQMDNDADQVRWELAEVTGDQVDVGGFIPLDSGTFVNPAETNIFGRELNTSGKERDIRIEEDFFGAPLSDSGEEDGAEQFNGLDIEQVLFGAVLSDLDEPDSGESCAPRSDPDSSHGSRQQRHIEQVFFGAPLSDSDDEERDVDQHGESDAQDPHEQDGARVEQMYFDTDEERVLKSDSKSESNLPSQISHLKL